MINTRFRRLLARQWKARCPMNDGDEVLVSDMQLDLTLVLPRILVFEQRAPSSLGNPLLAEAIGDVAVRM